MCLLSRLASESPVRAFLSQATRGDLASLVRPISTGRGRAVGTVEDAYRLVSVSAVGKTRGALSPLVGMRDGYLTSRVVVKVQHRHAGSLRGSAHSTKPARRGTGRGTKRREQVWPEGTWRLAMVVRLQVGARVALDGSSHNP